VLVVVEVVVLIGNGMLHCAASTPSTNLRDCILTFSPFARSSRGIPQPFARRSRSNYAPVNVAIRMSDVGTGTTFAVVTDRTHGGASLANGQLEVMVHRRLQVDDSRGVGEPLNETGINGLGLIARGLHRIYYAVPSNASVLQKTLTQQALFKPVVAFSNLTTSPAAWIATHKASLSGLALPLPPNLHLLSAQSYGPGKLLLRLAHLYEVRV
jgi:lysosomal alpha-mannosidase